MLSMISQYHYTIFFYNSNNPFHPPECEILRRRMVDISFHVDVCSVARHDVTNFGTNNYRYRFFAKAQTGCRLTRCETLFACSTMKNRGRNFLVIHSL